MRSSIVRKDSVTELTSNARSHKPIWPNLIPSISHESLHKFCLLLNQLSDRNARISDARSLLENLLTPFRHAGKIEIHAFRRGGVLQICLYSFFGIWHKQSPQRFLNSTSSPASRARSPPSNSRENNFRNTAGGKNSRLAFRSLMGMCFLYFQTVAHPNV